MAGLAVCFGPPRSSGGPGYDRPYDRAPSRGVGSTGQERAWGMGHILCGGSTAPPAFLVILRKSGPRQGRGSRRRRAFSCFVPLLLSSYLGTWEHLPSRCPSPLSAKGTDRPCFSYPEEALRLPTFCSSLFICSIFFFICSFVHLFVRSFVRSFVSLSLERFHTVVWSLSHGLCSAADGGLMNQKKENPQQKCEARDYSTVA
jgi:hypothetical protein